MTARPEECPRCRGSMQEGFTVDRGHGDRRRIPAWTAGPPEKSWFLGIRTKGRESYPVTTYRCSRCGYLESYARPSAG
jgi:hypothetical protein